jgi:hypothetical protein
VTPYWPFCDGMCNTKGKIAGVGSIIISSKQLSKCHQSTSLKDSFAEMLIFSNCSKIICHGWQVC